MHNVGVYVVRYCARQPRTATHSTGTFGAQGQVQVQVQVGTVRTGPVWVTPENTQKILHTLLLCDK
jgi:hypothetical protein